MFKGEDGEFVDYGSEFGEEDVETAAEEDQVGVVGAVAACSWTEEGRKDI